MNATQAIRQSARSSRIVTLPHSEEMVLYLSLRAVDFIDVGDVMEFWGESNDGEWRVHLARSRDLDVEGV